MRSEPRHNPAKNNGNKGERNGWQESSFTRTVRGPHHQTMLDFHEATVRVKNDAHRYLTECGGLNVSAFVVDDDTVRERLNEAIDSGDWLRVATIALARTVRDNR